MGWSEFWARLLGRAARRPGGGELDPAAPEFWALLGGGEDDDEGEAAMRVRMLVEVEIAGIEPAVAPAVEEDELRASAIYAVHNVLARASADEGGGFDYPIKDLTALRVVSVRGIEEKTERE